MKKARLYVRCPGCLSRIPVEPGAKMVSCPNCNVTFRICWPAPDQPMIRGLA